MHVRSASHPGLTHLRPDSEDECARWWVAAAAGAGAMAKPAGLPMTTADAEE
jgi:hypothetical protein